tara:strand:+ start:32423 stop:33223 length:801 start_codon:yes stop_codon:yes gene_type:complete
MKFFNNIPYDNIDPCFASFRQDGYKEDETWITNFLGSKFLQSSFPLIEKEIHYKYVTKAIRQVSKSPRYANCDDYYEYVALLQSILSAEKNYSLIKLGAYQGRWEAFACEANKQHKNLPMRITSIESHPDSLKALIRTFVENKLDDYQQLNHEVLVGYINNCYMKGLAYPRIDLTEIIERHGTVDLLDCDIQSGEKGLFEQHKQSMKRVRRVLIGTHSESIHTSIENLFRDWGWTCIANLPFRQWIQTEYGERMTEDGLQHWVNPH